MMYIFINVLISLTFCFFYMIQIIVFLMMVIIVNV